MATTEDMNKMYHWTRYIYDVTRKYYLLGRDRLLNDMELQPGDRVLEIGCGTARNLIKLAKQRPDIRCFGLDASTDMLAIAAAKVKVRRPGQDHPQALPGRRTQLRENLRTERTLRRRLLLLLAFDDPHLAASH